MLDIMSTDKMSNRQNIKQAKCRTDKMSEQTKCWNRQNVEQTKIRTEKMPTRQFINRENVDFFVGGFAPYTGYDIPAEDM